MMNRKIEEIIKERRVRDKEDYYFLYNNGFIGNRPLTWNSIDEIARSGWKGKICLRGKNGIPRSKSRFNLTFQETVNYMNKLSEEGIYPKDLTFNQSMPDEYLTIQGEVTREGRLVGGTPDWIYLTYSTIQEPMNIALEEETLHMQGIKALTFIKEYMDGPSYENLTDLFDTFPESNVEFSCYNIGVGDLKRNTIFWEVRNY